MSDVKETNAIKAGSGIAKGKLWKIDKEKSLKYWILFELICTLAGLLYIIESVQDSIVAFEGVIIVATVIILLRSILLFRLWYSIDS